MIEILLYKEDAASNPPSKYVVEMAVDVFKTKLKSAISSDSKIIFLPGPDNTTYSIPVSYFTTYDAFIKS